MDFMATLTWRPTLGWIPGPGGHASVQPAVLAAPETPPPALRNFTKDSVVLSAPETPPPAVRNFTTDSAGLSAPETPPPALRNL